jgi:MFS superfamily sulfate permease-like transporter
MPSVLIGIAIATILRATFALPIETVRVEAGLVSWVDWKSVSWTPQFFGAAILPTSIALALAASSESLLTLFSMSDSDKTRPPRPNRELVSQGIGNVVSGALGGLPIAIAMVRSQANRELDAKSYLSVLLHSMWLILFAGAVPFVLARVPTSALAAVLMITGFKMIDVSANRNFVREHRIEGGIGIITAISVFFFGILIGVAIGVLCSVAALVHTFSRLRIRIVESSSLQWTEIVLEGNANFLRLPKLGDALESMASRPSIRINTAALSYLDHATFSFLEKWAGDRAASGQTTELDLVTLRSRLQHRQPRPRNTPESL